jgi:nicotinate-nucleotide pyrophosphorylase (carboxylating)
MPSLPIDLIREHVARALAEDVGLGDTTTLATIPATATASACLVAREHLVLAGLDLACEAFHAVSPEISLVRKAADGDRLPSGAVALRIEGSARAILTAERVALNYTQRLSGIATLTAAYVQAIDGTKARILDTRKTTPGWRVLEKYAVRMGGGLNHRMGLDDMIMIKDNHLAALRAESPNAIAAAVARARKAYPNLKVEVEADTVAQAAQATEAGADTILLDNMTLEELRMALAVIGGRALTEASGGINLTTVRPVAQTGVNFISVGALTHSAKAVDLALDFDTPPLPG